MVGSLWMQKRSSCEEPTHQQDGSVGQRQPRTQLVWKESPPLELVGISSVGMERVEQFPYTLQHMLGKLDQRRQVEEVLIVDYALIKLGEFKNRAKAKNDFALRPGDVLYDATTVETMPEAIIQAVAYQSFAWNSTMCVSGAFSCHRILLELQRL